MRARASVTSTVTGDGRGDRANRREHARGDAIGASAYDDYVELARYAATRHYLLALLTGTG